MRDLVGLAAWNWAVARTGWWW